MLLVIARKFNDIFYSMSLPEWRLEKEKKLCIISNGIPKDSFPLQYLFDEVLFYSYAGESIRNIIKIVRQLSTCRLNKVDSLILSNPVLVTNQYLIKKVNPNSIIMIEDGSINYSSFHPSRNKFKKLFQMFLGIREGDIYSQIKRTYLFFPERGRFFFGDLRRLRIKKPFNIDNQIGFIGGKKIFAGQPLYDCGYISLHDYNKMVNKIIIDHKIDYYIPHAFSSVNEAINCDKILLPDYHVTLEVIAFKYDFEIYSFGSSVLYSCKAINPNIKSHLIKCSNSNDFIEFYELKFIESLCDSVLPFKK